MVNEIASSVNECRPRALALLIDTSVTRIVIEHQDRHTCFAFHSLDMLLAAQAWPVEIVNLAKNETTEDRIAD